MSAHTASLALAAIILAPAAWLPQAQVPGATANGYALEVGARLGNEPTDSCPPDTTGRSRMMQLTLGIAPGLTAEPKKANDDYLFAAQAIRARFRAPAAVSLPFWALTDADAQPKREPIAPDAPGGGLASRLEFRVTPVGRLVGGLPFVETASPELNASLVDAILAADSAGTLPVPGERVLSDGGWIRLRLVNYERRPAHSIPLVRLNVPRVRVDEGVEPISIPKPDYPASARGSRESGSVDLQYVVTEEGRADPDSFKPLRYADAEFIRAAYEALTAARFRPGSIGGCPVPMLVAQRVSFQVRTQRIRRP